MKKALGCCISKTADSPGRQPPRKDAATNVQTNATSNQSAEKIHKENLTSDENEISSQDLKLQTELSITSEDLSETCQVLSAVCAEDEGETTTSNPDKLGFDTHTNELVSEIKKGNDNNVNAQSTVSISLTDTTNSHGKDVSDDVSISNNVEIKMNRTNSKTIPSSTTSIISKEKSLLPSQSYKNTIDETHAQVESNAEQDSTITILSKQTPGSSRNPTATNKSKKNISSESSYKKKGAIAQQADQTSMNSQTDPARAVSAAQSSKQTKHHDVPNNLCIIANIEVPAEARVVMVGNTNFLGNWEPENGIELQFDASKQCWIRTIVVERGQTMNIEYKLLIQVSGNDEWIWQEGENRHITSLDHLPIIQTEQNTKLLLVDWQGIRKGDGITEQDEYLRPYAGKLQHRFQLFRAKLAEIDAFHGGLEQFSRGYEIFGLNRVTLQDGRKGLLYREWAPGAASVSLTGDFNNWSVDSHQCTRDEFGVWSCFVPDIGSNIPGIKHNSKIKVSFVTHSGERVWRIPAWIRHAVFEKDTCTYCGVHWAPEEQDLHKWQHPRTVLASAEDYHAYSGFPSLPMYPPTEGQQLLAQDPQHLARHSANVCESKNSTFAAMPASFSSIRFDDTLNSSINSGEISISAKYKQRQIPDYTNVPGLRIYEAHIGMSSSEGKIASYDEFTDNVLPRIKRSGYNAIQLMAVMEHPYYASFGYHVTNFFAASSRYGPPESLKRLIDTAHGMGIAMLLDVVHSHSAKNINDGLNQFDGTDNCYFHEGSQGYHNLWDSRLFDYNSIEVLRFLLSNLRWWMEEFRFDGFRFDGVTSMLYKHHGLSVGFSGNYQDYFGDDADDESCAYIMLANTLLHGASPPALSIAEDVSGMPGTCRPVAEGGLGFDFRLAMAIPDKWIELLKEYKDEAWDMGNIAHTLSNRRWNEKAVTYAESHDQALVGDKTLAFWLMDKEMYDHMSTIEQPIHPTIDRGLALHKLIRLITYGLGGEAYLNFMGNEFGHPEWIDFPREGNNDSFHHCRRQWNLVDDDLLHYKHLGRWDTAMHALEDKYQWLTDPRTFISLKHEGDKMICFDRGSRESNTLIFIFNFHPTQSYSDYRIGVPLHTSWKVALNSDWNEFGGYDRVSRDGEYISEQQSWCDRPYSIKVYIPARTVLVLAPVSTQPNILDKLC